MNIALILAGGIGQRMGQDVPKQFICIDNKPVFIYTLQNFQNSIHIDRILVACSSGWEAFVSSYAKQFNISKLDMVVLGGNDRFSSIKNLLDALQPSAHSDDMILVYDAVRPYISDAIISDAITKATLYGAAVGVLPCCDSMFATTNREDTLLINGANRDVLFRGIGPEVTSYGKATELFEKYSLLDSHINMIEMFFDSGLPVAKSISSSKCIKLTTVDDIELFQAILRYKKHEWLK